jgi:hypothetical protein
MSLEGDKEAMRDEMARRAVGEKRREKKMEKDCENKKKEESISGRRWHHFYQQ